MIAVGAWIAVGLISVSGIETPKYSVLEKKDGYEIREYKPYIVAEVVVTGEFKEALNGGFRQVADYIFGNNTVADKEGESKEIAMTAPVLEQKPESQEIAMTAPVLEQQPAGDASEAHIVSFVMPSEYTMATLPKPNNPDVKLTEVSAKKYAVLEFSGFVPAKKADEKKEEIRGLAARDGLKTTGEPLLAQYNPPWTPPFMRKNEVWLEIEP
ncbi:MAG: hypothetical protein AMXMBFR84_46910 [Candidatus Hydrogenedentota bacterium]